MFGQKKSNKNKLFGKKKVSQQNFWVKNIWVRKNFVSEIFWSETKNFESKRCGFENFVV